MPTPLQLAEIAVPPGSRGAFPAALTAGGRTGKQDSAPVPSTYGYVGQGALSGLAGRRRYAVAGTAVFGSASRISSRSASSPKESIGEGEAEL